MPLSNASLSVEATRGHSLLFSAARVTCRDMVLYARADYLDGRVIAFAKNKPSLHVGLQSSPSTIYLYYLCESVFSVTSVNLTEISEITEITTPRSTGHSTLHQEEPRKDSTFVVRADDRSPAARQVHRGAVRETAVAMHSQNTLLALGSSFAAQQAIGYFMGTLGLTVAVGLSIILARHVVRNRLGYRSLNAARPLARVCTVHGP